MKFLLVVSLLVTSVITEDNSLKKFATSSNAFSADLYQEVLLQTEKNLLVSSFSVETLLALIQAGAVGKTGAEIRTALHLSETVEETNSLFKTILPAFHSKYYKIHSASKIYVQNKYEIKNEFKSIAVDAYETAFENIAFENSTAAIDTINKWVQKNTEDKIKNFLPLRSVDATTRLVLVNALYFQANFSLPFVTTDTKKAAFYTSERESIETDLMFKHCELLNYAEDDELDAQIVELPFVGTSASLIVVVPKQKEGIALLEKQTASFIAAPKFSKKFVQLSLPKFKIENSIDFNPILQKLGITTAFSAAADLSNIAGKPGDLFIEKVIQKTYISVNEGGVEAAAATAIVKPTSVIGDPDFVVIADHPFAFYIQVDGVVLFNGRVLVPRYVEHK